MSSMSIPPYAAPPPMPYPQAPAPAPGPYAAPPAPGFAPTTYQPSWQPMAVQPPAFQGPPVQAQRWTDAEIDRRANIAGCAFLGLGLIASFVAPAAMGSTIFVAAVAAGGLCKLAAWVVKSW